MCVIKLLVLIGYFGEIHMRKEDIPQVKELRLPILEIFKKNGTSMTNEEVYDSLIKALKLPDEVRKLRDGKHQRVVLYNRMEWARLDLKNIGAVEWAGRGAWKVTDKGQNISSEEDVMRLVKEYSKNADTKDEEKEISPIYRAAKDWFERCLIEDGSLFFENESKQLWTIENIDKTRQLLTKVTRNNFHQSLKDHFLNLDECCQLMAETRWIIMLFLSNTLAQTKRKRVRDTWSWSGEELREKHPMLEDAVLGGIGSVGGFYAERDEIEYFLEVARKYKGEEKRERRLLFSEPWDFAKWLDKDYASSPQFRHVILHLLFPNDFERISSGSDKVRIISVFDGKSINEVRKESWIKIDRLLGRVRGRLEEEYDEKIDFYDDDEIYERWKTDKKPNANNKKSNVDNGQGKFLVEYGTLNLILYGPPGTGKTYRISENSIEEEENLLKNYIDSDGNSNYKFVTFHQNYSYEDFVEGIRPDIIKDSDEYEGKDSNKEIKKGDITYSVQHGVLRRICEDARKFPDERFALIIDEINRGNIAKIFGELITLIEVDKRIEYDKDSGERIEGCTGLEVTLPYSGDQFGVPKNVDFIGTMNTADRSIALLDSALRRRFEFKEIMPDPEILKSIPDGKDGEINLGRLLKTMNSRITHLLHQDQTIGHSYFWEIKKFEELQQVFAHKIIPLLREYFYNDWHQIQLVFADQAVDKKYQLVKATKVVDLFPKADDSIKDNDTFYIVGESEITPDSIRKIYDSSLHKKLEDSENAESSE